ncbi:MAG TPA: hypothetical protein VMA53_11605 [Stellaceae bacterium]|nr:hypothetical protein [Stellaceae bacterium]
MRQIIIASAILAGIAACGTNEMRQNGTPDPNGTVYPGYGTNGSGNERPADTSQPTAPSR